MAGYGDDTAFNAWLAENGLTLPVGAPSVAVLRQVGSGYVDAAYEWKLWCSTRTGGFTQERAWPRTGASVYNAAVPSDLIPPQWIQASYRAAYLQAVTPGWATGGTDPSRITKREKAGEVEREFFEAGKGAAVGNAAPGFRVDPMIDGLVVPWLCWDGSGALGIWSVGS